MPNTDPIFRPSAVQLIEMIRKLERRVRVLETSEGIFDINNENTPAVLSADQNDYDPGNYDILRISSSLAVSITGISHGVKGRRLQLFNVGSFAITLSNLNAASAAANQFNFVNASDFLIPPNGTALLYYDSTLDYWIGGDMSSVYDVVNEDTPAQITSDQDDYDIGLYEVLRLSASAEHTITGISGGVKGRRLQIFNVGSYAITLSYEDTASAAANRFKFSNGVSVFIAPGANTLLYYDSTQSRWVGGADRGANSIVDIQYVDGAPDQTFAGDWEDITGATVTLTTNVRCSIEVDASASGYNTLAGAGRAFFYRAMVDGTPDTGAQIYNGSSNPARNEGLAYKYFVSGILPGSIVVKLQCKADTQNNYVTNFKLLARALAEG